MLFILLSIAALAGLAFWLTFLRFRASLPADPEGRSPVFAPGPYFAWLKKRSAESLKDKPLRKTLSWFEDWTKRHYPGLRKWAFALYGLTVLYLAASGFFFAIFIPRGMYGFPLVGHVSLGAVFALGLAYVLFERGRDYRIESGGSSAALVNSLLFWGMGFLGLVQILTALLSLLPLLYAQAQGPLIEIHRYSGLGFLLSAIAFIDRVWIPARRA